MAPTTRERKPGPPMLEKGNPEPAGKAKPRAKATRRKATSGGSKSKGRSRAANKDKSDADAGEGGSNVTDPLQSAATGDSTNNGAATSAPVDPAEGETADHPDEVDEGDEDEVFCVCLGKDDGRPMIMCEACENWFHFSCINLSEQDAARISTYCCALCEQAGSGKTIWNDEPPAVEQPSSNATSVPPLPPATTQNEQDAFTSGVTAAGLKTMNPAPTEPLPPLPGLPPMPAVLTPSDSGDEYEGKDHFEGSDDDYTGAASPARAAARKKQTTTAAQRRRASSGAATSNSKRRKRVVEDDDDKAENSARDSKRRASSGEIPVDRFGLAKRPSLASTPSKDAIVDASPTENRTRKHCIEQLTKIISTIPTSPDTPNAIDPPTLAQAIEADLFAKYAEIEKNERGPRQRYTARFRTLHFNLKNNEYFRKRVGSGELDAARIVSLEQEDLLTPEARAEQEAIREQSLAQSVKVQTALPKTRHTHKGEEVIDEFDSGMMEDSTDEGGRNKSKEDASYYSGRNQMSPVMGTDVTRSRSRSQSVANAGSPNTSFSGIGGFGSPTAMSPMAGESTTQGMMSPKEEMGPPAPVSARRESMSATPAGSPGKDTLHTDASYNADPTRPPLPHHTRSDSMSKSRLDLDSVWGAYKAPRAPSESPAVEEKKTKKDKEEDDMDTDSDEDKGDQDAAEKKPEEEYDPFATTTTNADDDFDAIFGDNDKEEGKDKEQAPSKEAVENETRDKQASSDEIIASLPAVWQGAVQFPSEGGFPTRSVQVAGTSLGTHPHIWDQVLPKSIINISGTIEIARAVDYLLQVRFSKSREMVVIAHLPNGTTAEGADPAIPSMEKAIAKRQHLINHFSASKRYGVMPPSGNLKKYVKDHYLVSLKTADPLPDFIELLDNQMIGETGDRDQDMLLSVLVLQKGILSGSGPPASTTTMTTSGGNTPQQHSNSPRHAPPAASLPATSFGTQMAAGSFSPSTQIPGLQPAPGALHQAQSQPPPSSSTGAALPALDNAALQSLLSNPALLQALNSTSQGSPPVANAGNSPGPGGFAGTSSQLSPYAAQGSGPYNPSPYNPSASPYSAPQQQPHPPPAPSAAWGAPGPVPPVPPVHGGQPGYPPPPSSWNPSGSPPWQGSPPVASVPFPPPQQGGWGPPQSGGAGPGPGPRPGPGNFIHPDRAREAQYRGREVGQQPRRDSRDPYHPRRDGDRGGPPNSSRGGERRGSGGSGGGPRGGTHRGSTSNQMQAGIQDRGWGSRR